MTNETIGYTGLALAISGIAAISWPAALIAAGLFLLAYAIISERTKL